MVKQLIIKQICKKVVNFVKSGNGFDANWCTLFLTVFKFLIFLFFFFIFLFVSYFYRLCFVKRNLIYYQKLYFKRFPMKFTIPTTCIRQIFDYAVAVSIDMPQWQTIDYFVLFFSLFFQPIPEYRYLLLWCV